MQSIRPASAGIRPAPLSRTLPPTCAPDPARPQRSAVQTVRPRAGDAPNVPSPSVGLPVTPEGLVRAGPSDAPPDYTAIDARPLNKIVYSLFRRRMAQALGGRDSTLEGYPAIIDLTRRLNAAGSPRDTQAATRSILASLFPSWLPGAFAVMFARPLTGISSKLNAWATWLTCQWLMGPCEVNDVPLADGATGAGQGVLVARCRYLEEAGCAAVCINSCKVPTQEFFARDMGLPLTMTPNYETFECQFAFGVAPPPCEGDAAFETPCFAGCPTAAAKRSAGSGERGQEACHRIEAPDAHLC